MIAVPAVDLRNGRCVQLVGGRPDVEKVSLPDPVDQAKYWWDLGFRHLHVVDLDAALGMGDNRGVVQEIVEATGAEIQVGGGVRSASDLEEIVALGVARVIAGTRAVEDPEWLQDMASRYPGRIMVAADVREGIVLRRGWTEATGVPIQAILDRLNPLPLAGVLCTDVSREGRMEGIDLQGAEAVIRGTRHRTWISGGITTMEEVRALDRAGATGAVLGMAIYTEVLPPQQLAEEFGE
jgi:phosphoribosylformimino-5-aminoimidazole carboxamide ribotide isomerase